MELKTHDYLWQLATFFQFICHSVEHYKDHRIKHPEGLIEVNCNLVRSLKTYKQKNKWTKIFL